MFNKKVSELLHPALPSSQLGPPEKVSQVQGGSLFCCPPTYSMSHWKCSTASVWLFAGGAADSWFYACLKPSVLWMSSFTARVLSGSILQKRSVSSALQICSLVRVFSSRNSFSWAGLLCWLTSPLGSSLILCCAFSRDTGTTLC